jgi:hypothetical protein
VQELNQSADERMKFASLQSQALVDAAFQRLYVALGAFFSMLILYRVITLVLTRRLRHVAVISDAPNHGNGRERDAATAAASIDRIGGTARSR